MKNRLTLVLVAFALISVMGACGKKPKTIANDMEVKIIPLPLSLEKTDKPFVISAQTKLILNSSDGNAVQVADFITSYINEMYGVKLANEQGEKIAENSIFLNFKGEGIAEEGYTFLSNGSGITITATTSKGVFYGIQTLIQLLPTTKATQNEIVVAGVKINDEPRFKWRGVHLDVCRHFMPVELVKKTIALLALHKMNTFHWHLTEDQGWRIEIKKYPKLTEIGSIRKETVVGHMADHPMKFDSVPHSGFYTQEEIKDVVAYAAKHFVTIVPEIELPGHAQAALAAYPQFSCTGGPFEVWNQWGVSEEVYCAGKDSTFIFLEEILSEVIELFPGEYFHIGGDECPKTRWDKCADCQKRMKTEKLANAHELQSYFIKRMENFLNSKGKKLIGWDEILEGGLPERASVMSWRGESGGIEAANSGHDVVMTPGNWCYFDHYQAVTNEPLAIAGLTTLSEVYGYDPMPKEIKEDKRHHILGAQANLWTEYIPTPEHAEYMLFPRLSAIAEILWTPKDMQNYDDFKLRMDNMYLFLDNKNVNYRIDYPKGYNSVNRVAEEQTTVTLSCEIPSAQIRYTIDGSEPTANSSLYTEPIVLNLKEIVTLKSKTFMPNGRSSVTISGTFEKIAPQAAVEVQNPLNGLKYSYYELETNSAEKIEGKVVKSGVIDSLKIPKEARPNFFGLIYEGFLNIEKEGLYNFYMFCDDGAVLYIDDVKIVDNDGFKYGYELEGHTILSKGFHTLKVKYFNAKYGASLKVWYSTNGVERTEIPASMLFYSK